MGSILNKKIIALGLCFSILFSNFVFVSEVFGQTAPDYSTGGFGEGIDFGSSNQSGSGFESSGQGSETNWYENDNTSSWSDIGGGLYVTDEERSDTTPNGQWDYLATFGSGRDASGGSADGGGLLPPKPGGGNDDGIDQERKGDPDELLPPGGVAGPGYTQADLSRSGTGQKSSTGKKDSTSKNLGKCAIGAALGKQVSNAISKGAKSLLSNIGKRTVKATTASTTKVPVSDSTAQEESAEQTKKLDALKSKEVGDDGFFGIKLPSLDSIGYCLINTMILYISEATIRWINTGFKGNPAYIENFDRFFSDLADREISMFLGEIASTDLLCPDLRVGVQRGLQQSYNNRYSMRSGSGQISGSGKCTFGSSTSQSNGINLASYNSGDQTAVLKGGWGTFSQVFEPQNNIYGATIMAKQEASRRIEQRQELTIKETIDSNNAHLSAKDAKGNVYSPGSNIQKQLQKRLEMPDDRLILADEFDEIVTALVNQLVKIALDETVGKLNGAIKKEQSELQQKIRDIQTHDGYSEGSSSRGNNNCSTTYTPVCAKSGVTYTNQCVLDATNGEEYDYSGVCTSDTTADNCSEDYEPVCAESGTTYANRCILDSINDDSYDYEGTCNSDVDPSDVVCTSVYTPVCGRKETGIVCVTTPCDTTEDVTYSNLCELNKESVPFLHEGVCTSNI